MKQTTQRIILISLLAVLAAGLLVYLPGMDRLGLYRDDWNNFFNAVTSGPEKLIEHYASDRPADGYLIGWVFRALGTNYRAYLYLNLGLRLIGALCFTLALFRVWPRNGRFNLTAGILCVIFPGFLQQIDGIAYVPHQAAMTAFFLSLWLTAVSLTTPRRGARVCAAVFALVFAVISPILMEYYIGMEAFRFGLIYVLIRRERTAGSRGFRAVWQAFLSSLLHYLPYVAAMIAFVVWRSFFFDATRNGTDVVGEVIAPLLEHPRYAGLTLLSRILKNWWKLFIGVWTVPLHDQVNGLEMKAFWAHVPLAAVTTALTALLISAVRRCESAAETDEEGCWKIEWLLFGLICGALSVTPLVLAGRDLNFASSLDRFAWPGAPGTILFLLGCIGLLSGKFLRCALVGLTVFSAAFVQLRSKQAYIDIWADTQDYWQQLLWRAPGLKKGTTILTAGGFVAEEDYEIFAPANLIYFPKEGSHASIGAEILNTGTARSVEMGETDERITRSIFVEKDYTKLIALTKPTGKSCVQVIDGSNPIYSHNEWSKIPEVGTWSRPEQIDPNPSHYATPPFFLGEEQAHGWCYYYEKISLALQFGDAETAAALADEAAANGLRAEDWVEWVPVIEAYVEAGRPEEAEQFIAILKSDDWLHFETCRYFGNKSDTAYSEVIRLLCN